MDTKVAAVISYGKLCVGLPDNFLLFLLLLLLLYIIVSFMQGSHTRIPGTNHVPRGYIAAAILSLLFMVPLCLVPALVLFFYVSTFRKYVFSAQYGCFL